MKKILMICVAALCCLQMSAWGQGVDFQDLTFQQALDKAKAEGKLVFMDCYTSWCGPCKHMTENVFPMAVMGEYFNKTFVNVKFDMEKGEGITLRRKFGVNSFPTFFILRPDGTVQHRIAGARPQERFLEAAKRGANEETSLAYLQKLYNEGKATPEQTEAYRTALSDAGDRGTLFLITKKDFEGMTDEQRCAATSWYIYDQEAVGVQTPQFAAMFNVVDSFDTHANIPAHFEEVDGAAKKSGKLALISCGWDPGMFSIARVYGDSVLPGGATYTFWGKGVSQGHSDAIRRIEGVVDARQYTVPVQTALDAVRSGKNPELSTREKHTRECYVVVEEGADKARIEKEIKEMPNYFADYDTTVNFISQEELNAKHKGIPHGGFVIRSGKTGSDDEFNNVVEYSLKLDSNPAFTSSVLVAYARAVARMSKEGKTGCVTVLDIPPSYLSAKSGEELRKSML